MPQCVIEDITNEFDPTAYEKALGDLLVKHESDTSKFLQSVFSFLNAKTNFFKQVDPKKKILDALKEAVPDHEGLKTGFLPKSAKIETPVPVPKDETPATIPSPKPQVKEVEKVDEDAKEIEEPIPVKTVEVPETVVDEEPEEKSKGMKPNDQRGADFETHSWGQTLTEVTVSIPVPKGTRARQLAVTISKQRLKVGLVGQDPIIDDDLSETVKAEDSLWNLSDNVVEISLQKVDGMHWWASLLKSDPIIDTQKVEPESSKLGDLDADTRQTVEKMMFDQRQKAMGLPSSDELKKQEMLKKFMASHPEMDFSKAKVM
mmetsp:Transcript_18638/g.33853  ORF Transcript_18638/g.33853 Transcript_18638/m.33853 type:complete len:317 (-) Transcript_18638:455-1405(-)|eukprot:CAMPEP_0175046210 /NCGR_PEP_ID=MMETSP0052_2-20121109/4897_1 /TAXON_ID=51329 ORGANISM="Polytomella parva, Strain SAG 63-3" /NCGR_SAMPLE_ID=MMETSP0052_2 /ASSEMBLY_ACC=CAM_ASM_000194 /LENGTH=316 /DNA_ID=CAMNT_0016309917 /DNA_START=15 /DNA_END=965 /DNA_ORIENTATION=+